MSALKHLIPEHVAVIDMEVPDLAGYILEPIAHPNSAQSGHLNRRNFCMQAAKEYGSYETGSIPDVGQACAEGWNWLEANGLICRHYETDDDWYVITKRGRSIRNRHDLHEFIRSEQLPESFLHAELLLHVRPLYFQGRLDSAVFEAYKTLEVAIRRAAKLGHDAIGTKLAAAAFNPIDGPLTDTTAEHGERQALMNLMVGALGSLKNPSSHRRVELSPIVAREMIILASYLLRIVDARGATPSSRSDESVQDRQK